MSAPAIAQAAADSATEWGALGAIAVVLGKAAWDLILRLTDKGSAKPNGGGENRLSSEEREYLNRLEQSLRDIRDRVQRLDDAHQVRRADGTPAFFCSAHRLEPQIAEIHQMIGRLLDEQRQSRGLLSRIARTLKLDTRDRSR